MKHLTLDELIEFLADMRDKGQSGDTPVVTRGSFEFKRVRNDRITTKRATKKDIDRNVTNINEAATRGVEVIVIG